MAKYSYYEKGFTEESRKLIDELIERDVDIKILDLMTQINKDKKQVFNHDEIGRIYCDTLNGYSFDVIKLYAINHEGHSVYDDYQMSCIMVGIAKDYAPEIIDIYAKLNSNMEPIHDSHEMDLILYAIKSEIPINKIKDVVRLNDDNKTIYSCEQMREIFEGMRNKLDERVINFYSELNSLEKPIFSGEQMNIIRHGTEDGLPLEYIKIYAQCKDEKPIFSFKEMDWIKVFMLKALADNKVNRINQVKECIDNKLTFDQIKLFLSHNVSAENIRLYRSLYDLGLTVKDAEEMIKKDEKYENLKELKYLLRCAKEFNINDIKHILKYRELSLVGSLAAARDISNHDELELIERFLSFKMPPDQIDFLTQPEHCFSYEDMKIIAVGFLNGITIDEMKSIAIESKVDGYKLPYDIEKDINKLINSKINKSFNTEENFDFCSELESILERGD